MANPPVTLAGVYDIIAEYENVADAAIKWRNTYTFASSTPPTPTAGISVVLGGFCLGMGRSAARLVKLTCYAWARGRQPYPAGQPLWVNLVNLPCTGDTYWTVSGGLTSPFTPTGNEIALRVDHVPASAGRPGRNFYRVLVGLSDLTAIAGGLWRLIIAILIAVLQTILDNLATASGLSAYFGSGTGGQNLVVVRYSRKTGVVHGTSPVTSFSVIGVTTNRATRKNPK